MGQIGIGCIAPEPNQTIELDAEKSEEESDHKSIDTQDAKNLILNKRLVDKVGLAFVKQNHESTLAQFYTLLPE